MDHIASPAGGPVRPVPQRRIMEKVDECMARKDYPGVERVLSYWLLEARQGRDLRGEMMIQNELVGHYRKTGEREKAHQSADEALRLIREAEYEGSLSAATAYVNIATMYNSFGENDAALALFEQAKAIYENHPGASPALMGGLYNNMGLTCAALGRFDQAAALYRRAMEKMALAPHGAIEQAVTCLNMANAVEARDGMERGEAEIFRLLDQAEAFLDQPELPRNGYYAYVCEKCAPTFAYYGYFAAAQALQKRAKEIYDERP